MGFVQTTFLAALAAIAIPIVVHLIFRWQTRRVDLGTVRFLSEILRETARRRRLKRWLLLALRIGAVALLAVLFARPYLRATQTAGSERFVAILIDCSASMSLQRDGRRLVDLAVERARRILAEAGDADVEVVFFDSRVHPVAAVDGRRDLEVPAQLAHATSYGAALAWARDLCVKARHSRRDVYVLTDLQRSGLDWPADGGFPEGAIVTVEDLGRDDVSNAAIVHAAPAETLVRPGEGVEVRATLFNDGPFPLNDVPVSLTLSRERTAHRRQQIVSLPPQQAVEIEFQIDALEAGLWQGTVELAAEDDLAFDNRRHLAVLAAAQQRVLVVEGDKATVPDAPSVRDSLRPAGGSGVPETFFLESALRLAPAGEAYAGSPFLPVSVRYGANGRLPSLGDFDLVVLADVGEVSEADAARLAGFVRGGRGLLVFTGERTTAESCAALARAGLAPGTIGGIARSHDLPYRWQEWDETHPLLAPFADPQHGDLRRLAFTAYTRIEPADGADVLARFGNHDAALTKHAVGEGRVVWFLSSCGPGWGDWTRSRLFLPLVHQMLGDLAGLTGGGPVRMAVLDELEGVRPGVFRHDDHWLVVNVSSRESETERCTPAEFAERFQFQTPGTEAPEAHTAGVTGPSRQLDLRADEVWHWALWLLIGVVCLECFVANRTTA